MDEVDPAFHSAADYVERHASELNDDKKLQLYGLYKQATSGPCTSAKPSFFDFKGRTKWSAWDTVSGLSEESAREQYVGLVAQFFPKWNDECTSYHPEAALAGPVFSSLANSKECAGDLSDAAPEGGLHIRASMGDIAGVEHILNMGVQVDQRDDQECTPLHWAADRGSQQVINLLLAHGADINATDVDGQTPLQYAMLCDHEQVCVQLVKAGAH